MERLALFDDPLHQQFAENALGTASFGGAEPGELRAIASKVAPGDDESFHAAFGAFAQRLIGEAETRLARGHAASARECFLRAAQYLSNSLSPLFGTPVDPRLVTTYRLMMATFERALALGTTPATRLDLPYEDTTLPGYFVRAPGYESAVRPTIIVGGGWDSNMVWNWFGIAAPALARGYHVLLHDGPGQGGALIERGLALRHDWEKVVTPVVDVVLGLEGVDPDRVVYQPWSLGGYMAPRVAAFEHRLAAIVCDPGQLSIGGKIIPVFGKMGLSPEAVARLPQISAEDEAKLMAVVRGNRVLHWQVVRRAFWTNGVHDLSGFVAELMKWTLDTGTVARIRCPALVMAADGDRASTDTRQLFEAMRCPKTFVQFTEEAGAAQHCEALNRSLAARTIYDWLDETLAPARQ